MKPKSKKAAAKTNVRLRRLVAKKNAKGRDNFPDVPENHDPKRSGRLG
jgi:hypothetical protein